MGLNGAVVCPQEHERLRSYHESGLRGEPAPAYYECQGIKKDGSIIRLESGVQVVEIPERKRAEQALPRAHDEPEPQGQERTAELARANKV